MPPKKVVKKQGKNIEDGNEPKPNQEEQEKVEIPHGNQNGADKIKQPSQIEAITKTAVNDNTENNSSKNSSGSVSEKNLEGSLEEPKQNLLKSKISAGMLDLKNPKKITNDLQSKMELRKLRFGSGLTNQVNTISAAEIAEAEKKKLQERAKKFGLTLPEDEELKKKKRAERFNLPSKTSDVEEKQKKMERALRFGITTQEVEDEKKKARMERFGKVLGEEENLGKKKIKIMQRIKD